MFAKLIAVCVLPVAFVACETGNATTPHDAIEKSGAGIDKTSSTNHTRPVRQGAIVIPLTGVCKPDAVCFHKEDCGATGKCLGIFPGTCDCAACINAASCVDDSACGGLVGACDAATQSCKCLNGYIAHGFPTLAAANQGLCNSKHCTGSGRLECFGLPCNIGRCSCN